MRAERVAIDADGLPLYRTNPACVMERIDVVTVLELEQQALLREDLDRCGIQEGGKAGRSPGRQGQPASLG